MLSSNTSAVSGDTTYIEDVFSTYLYTGNGTSQTIANGIDLAGKGGMTWIKGRSSYANNFHTLTDTVRGAGKSLRSNDTSAEWVNSAILSSFSSTGFSVGGGDAVNLSAAPIASWTFRKQPKFFDVVTYTGTGAVQNIAHSLGSVPGCIIVKQVSSPAVNWYVYHTSIGNNNYLSLNQNIPTTGSANLWNSTTPTSTQFTVGTSASVNASGGTYVAYLFAHNAGGFGLTGTDNVISCGGGTFDSNGYANVTLGYEPQWVLIKPTSYVDNWYASDNMRGMSVGSSGSVPYTAPNQFLYPNTSGSETASNYGVIPTSTGFKWLNGSSGGSFIYIAIRRGPMKVPTDGTKVFNTPTYSGTATYRTQTGVGFPPDLVLGRRRAAASQQGFFDRLRGPNNILTSTTTNAEATSAGSLVGFDVMDGYKVGDDQVDACINFDPGTYAPWSFRRAPSFFDEVCYTGTGTNVQAQPHNLGVVPELIIIKKRSSVDSWFAGTDLGSSTYTRLLLNSTAAGVTTTYGSGTVDLGAQPTTTNFYLGTEGRTNGSAATYVAYLFATCAGVSKVGSYTGNGSSQTIACGFAAGARFVLIKRTDSTGDWYVWDTARGIVSGNDPHLSLNTTAAEVTTDDTIDPDSSGFIVNQLAATNVNVNAATYIFLAIA